MPLLRQENPSIASNLSATALRLRQDEDCLAELSQRQKMDVEELKSMHPAIRSRCLERFLKGSGVREPEASHIAQAESLVFSEKPSAFARFPGNVVIARNYRVLTVQGERSIPEPVELPVPGSVLWGDYRITASAEGEGLLIYPDGPVTIRSRAAGDCIRLSGGTKTLKKLFIDCKIPAAERGRIPVLADSRGVLAVYGFGTNPEDKGKTSVRVRIEKIIHREEKENA
jgi:tRNA(Ile)-lysidine synthase